MHKSTLLSLLVMSTSLMVASVSALPVADERLDFVVARGVAVYEGDLMMVTGKSEGTVPLGSGDSTCSATDGHLQRVVFVDPGAGRAAQHAEAVILAPADLPPGSRVEELIPLGICLIGSEAYDMYSGIVR
jgi:hypothetical protein